MLVGHLWMWQIKQVLWMVTQKILPAQTDGRRWQADVEYILRVWNIPSSLSPWADLDILWYDSQWQVVSLLGTNLTVANNFNRVKYGLAIINELFTVFGKGLGLGYDIACSFNATVQKSSIAAAASFMHTIFPWLCTQPVVPITQSPPLHLLLRSWGPQDMWTGVCC